MKEPSIDFGGFFVKKNLYNKKIIITFAEIFLKLKSNKAIFNSPKEKPLFCILFPKEVGGLGRYEQNAEQGLLQLSTCRQAQ